MSERMTTKKLIKYCEGRTCQTQCDYNHICYYCFKLGTPCDAYAEGKGTDRYRRLSKMITMINKNEPNDIGKLLEKYGSMKHE